VKAAEHSRNRIAWGLTLLVSKRRTVKLQEFCKMTMGHDIS
jgi:hypothetical protein